MKKIAQKKIAQIIIAVIFLTGISSQGIAANGDGNEIKIIKNNLKVELKTASESGINTILVVTDINGNNLEEAIKVAEGTAALRSKVMVAIVNRDLDENNNLNQKYNLARYPTPFLLIVSPSGSITGGSAPGRITPEKLAAYVPSPCHNQALSARLNHKATFIFITGKEAKTKGEWNSLIETVQSSLSSESEVISVDVDDENEKSFLSRIGYKNEAVPMLMVLNASGQVTGKYVKLPEANVVAAAATKVVSKSCASSCPGSKSCSSKEKAKCGSK